MNLNVTGVYDSVQGDTYAHLASDDNDKIDSIYINFGDDENSSLSNIEYDGETFPMTCSSRK